jgi:hypothetical protein
MKSSSLCVLGLLLSAPALPAQAVHDEHGGAAAVGRVGFETSCSAVAAALVEEAVAKLHSFWYEEAERAFGEAAVADPGCAMAHWGVAMSLYHPLWEPPDSAALARGRQAAERAARIGGGTERERAYVAAVNAFYRDADRLDHRTRAAAYEAAMADLHAAFPEDREATVFYALAVRVNAPPSDKTYARQRAAAELLDRVSREQPDHPGVVHYLIHSYDYPALAALGLDAARRYARIAPAVPHALHMPSHIFIRLGLWREAIDSNLATAAAAREIEARDGSPIARYERLHALDYLAYAYLQLGDEAAAARVLADVAAVTEAPSVMQSAYALAAVPARYALERGDWRAAAALRVAPADFPWDRYRAAEAMTVFARALGAARSGDVASARNALARLEALRDGLRAAGDDYWDGQVEIQRLAAEAWIRQAEGRDAEARDLMRAAADLEDSTEKHPVTPGPVRPARELLGELLLEQGRPAEALPEFEAVLANAPGRRNARLGASLAAERAGVEGGRERAAAALPAGSPR